jgi:phosphatidylinositol 4-kinase
MIFHEDLKSEALLEFVRQAAYVDFFFGHLLYFYLSSVSKTVYKKYTENYPLVEKMLEAWAEEITLDYSNRLLIAAEMLNSKKKKKINICF